VVVRTLLVYVLTAIILVACENKKKNSTCKVTVLTYASFAGLLGPGKALSEGYKTQSGCEIRYINFTDNFKAQKLLQQDSIDVIMGLDLLSLQDFPIQNFLEYSNFSTISFQEEIKEYATTRWIPIDWSPLTIIKRKRTATEDKTVDKLYGLSTTPLEEWNWKTTKLSLQDPRVSTTGLYFLWWWDYSDPLKKLFKINPSDAKSNFKTIKRFF
jgi:ABC-type thiamine transport system substrate-binding protein